MTPKAIADSVPCAERCPICHERCYGKQGHNRCATAGKHYAQPHMCRRHFWGTSADWIEIARSEGHETRREVVETIQGCRRCVEAVKRLG